MEHNEPNETNVPRAADVDQDTNRRGVYLTDDTWKAAKSKAALKGISTSRLIEEAVLDFIKAA